MRSSTLLTIVLLLAFSLPVTAQEELYLEGADYRELAQRLPSAGGEAGKVEVIEFFWYGCPHCYALEPFIEEWRRTAIPSEASFVRVPAALNESWRNHAKAYYVAEALDALDSVHGPLFDAIHQGGEPLSEPAELRAFFVSRGVDGAAFDAAWNSYAVDASLRRADVLARTAGISGVPSMVIGGRYESTVTLAGGREELLDVVNFLVAQQAGAGSPGD
jgi:thiol:disulfide interchange protein DsbA